MHQHHKGIWVAYILSLFTPFTLLLSGVIAIIYAGYRLDKGELQRTKCRLLSCCDLKVKKF